MQSILSSSFLVKNVKIKIYRIILLPVGVYGFETWSLTLREEHWVRVVENTLLRKILELKRDEVTGELRGLYNEELYDLYCLLNIISVIKGRLM
jgi:hypothetical protein